MCVCVFVCLLYVCVSTPYLFAFLLCSHLLKRGLKLPDKIVFPIRVPVPHRALQNKRPHIHEYGLLKHGGKCHDERLIRQSQRVVGG